MHRTRIECKCACMISTFCLRNFPLKELGGALITFGFPLRHSFCDAIQLLTAIEQLKLAAFGISLCVLVFFRACSLFAPPSDSLERRKNRCRWFCTPCFQIVSVQVIMRSCQHLTSRSALYSMILNTERRVVHTLHSSIFLRPKIRQSDRD